MVVEVLHQLGIVGFRENFLESNGVLVEEITKKKKPIHVEDEDEERDLKEDRDIIHIDDEDMDSDDGFESDDGIDPDDSDW